MIHTLVITVKQADINIICDSYKWYHINIHASYLIIDDMFSHTLNFNQVLANDN